MRIAPTRLFTGVSMLVHQPTSRISLPVTADKDKVANADLLFAYLEPRTGFLAFNTQPRLVKKFEAIYNANGTLNIQSVPAFVTPWFMLVNMLHFVTWNVDGWTPFEQFRANTELWPLMVHAQGSILTLPRFGWTGWLLSFIVKSWAAGKLNMPLVEGAKPMKLEEFNAFPPWRKGCKARCSNIGGHLRRRRGCRNEDDCPKGDYQKGSRDRDEEGEQEVREYLNGLMDWSAGWNDGVGGEVVEHVARTVSRFYNYCGVNWGHAY